MNLYSKSLLSMLMFLLSAVAAQAVEDEMYRIKPGDVLSIYVHQNSDLTLSVNVLPDGTISYPLIGNLYVQGLTTAGLENILTQKLTQYLQNPVVVITISSETQYKIFVMGEVRMPHDYIYQEGKRLTDYLAMAGGPGEEANLKKCHIYPADVTRPRITVDLRAIFNDENRNLNIELQPNDTILLERRSGFIVTEWYEIGQIFSVLVGIATIYLISERR